MTNVLIVDDEKIEREGLKYLLSREEGERTVFEAANGKQALQVLRSEDIQLLLTDIKMPHMTGLELSKKAKEENPNLQIIIFSGFSDFTFAQEAIRYGVTEYILKPVNPDDFHKVLERAESEISKRRKKESREIKEKNFLQQYFLQSYLYSGKKEILQKAGELIDLDKWNSWHCAILIESDVALFDTAEENLEQELQKELHRMFFYMNLNARQSLILFQDVYCDYQLVANHIYNFLKREYMERFYLAVTGSLTDVKVFHLFWSSWNSRWRRNSIIRTSMCLPMRMKCLAWQSEKCRILSLCRRFPRISPARI